MPRSPAGVVDTGAMPTAEELNGLDHIAATFVTASRALVAIAIRSIEAAPVAVPVPQHRVLVLLAANGPQAIGTLAQQLGVNPSNATRVCDRLERLDLVRRAPPTSPRRAGNGPHPPPRGQPGGPATR